MTEPAPALSGALRIRDLRRNRALAPGGQRYPEVVARFLPQVYGAAAAMIPENPEAAETVAWAVFEALAARWRSLSGKTLVAPWLVRSLGYAVANERSRLKLKAKASTERGVLTQRLFRELNGLNTKLAAEVILKWLLGEAANEKKAEKGIRTLEKPIKKLAAKLQKGQPEPVAFEVREALRGMALAPAPEVEQRILEKAGQWTPKTRRAPLTRATLGAWQWRAIGRFFRGVGIGVGATLFLLFSASLTFKLLMDHGKINVVRMFIASNQRELLADYPDLAKPARPWSPGPQVAPKTASELYNLTNIWAAKISMTEAQWKAIQPHNVPPAQNLPNGKMALRNSKASRSGLAGALGIDFQWSEGAFEFGDAKFDAVGVRFRGNGTYLNSLYGNKTSFKVDLNRVKKGNQIGGITTLNFVNSIPDFSYMKDALAEKLFQQLGAVAPRTTYAYLTLDVPGTFTNHAMGLYVVVEDIDGDFAKDHFGTKEAPIFKPVTYDLFADWGKDWSAYAEIYDLKTKGTPEQLARVPEFAQLVTHATDEEFAKRLEEFLDFEEYAAFLAGHVLMASYDGYLSNGQNFYMYLDPRSNKFGFIPWDQDHGWGEFGYVGKPEGREAASIWQPSAYANRFLERVLKVEAFKTVYRRKLEEGMAGPFTEARLFAEIDRVAAAIRPAVAAESDFRLVRFNVAVKSAWIKGVRDAGSMNDNSTEGPRAHPHQLKRFITTRIKSVRDQLDGKSEGVRLSGFGQ